MLRLFAVIASALFVATNGWAAPVANKVVKDSVAVAAAQKAMAYLTAGSSLVYQDSTATGSLTMHGDTGDLTFPVTLSSKGTREFRYEIAKPQGKDVYTTDGTTACIARADGTNQIAAFQNLYGQRIDHIPFLTLLSEFDNPNMNVQYAGTDTVNGVTTDVIAVSFSFDSPPMGFDPLTGTQHLFYIDRTTGTILKMQFSRVGENEPDVFAKTEMYFSDYRLVNGLMVPFHRLTVINDIKAADLALSTVTFNNGLSDQMFDSSCGVANAN